jgi:hypothetical protein
LVLVYDGLTMAIPKLISVKPPLSPSRATLTGYAAEHRIDDREIRELKLIDHAFVEYAA